MNSSTPTEITTPALTWLQISACIVFTTLTSASILAYILVLVILYLYFKEFHSNFYCIVISLAIVDLISLTLKLVYLIPSTVLQRDVWIPLVPRWVAGQIETIGYYMQCTHLTYIGLNRLVYAAASGLHHPRLDRLFDNRWAITVWIVVLWAFPFALPVAVQMAGSDLVYDYVHMAFTFENRPHAEEISRNLDAILTADSAVAGALPVLITLSHSAAWIVIYVKGRQQTMLNLELVQLRRRERRLLVQFTLISAVLILYYVLFWAIPHWFPGNVGLVVITFLAISTTAVNPFTYLAFNKLMKSKAKHLSMVWRKKVKYACSVLAGRSNTVGPTM